MPGQQMVLPCDSVKDLCFCRAILRDPDIYPEPETFKPERFLNSDGTLRDDPILSSVFGYGKRICPGRHVVDTTLFIFLASLLSVFRIEKAKGDQSEYKYTGGALRYTYTFLRQDRETKTDHCFY
jgi:cytochrome P450